MRPLPNNLPSWNAPHLLSHLFQLFNKFIDSLNSTVPPEHGRIEEERLLREVQAKIVDAFNHKMMPSWLALAKFYYSFYHVTEEERALISELEVKLNINIKDFDSLSALLRKIFFSQYPKVNGQYQTQINNIETVMAKLIAVALSTPYLLNDAHEHDQKRFEAASPSISSCIGPIETILRQLLSREEMGKSVVVAALSFLSHVKIIKSHFEQLSLIQQLESLQLEMDKLQAEQEKSIPPENNLLQRWQSKDEQLALLQVSKLQEKVNEYYAHLSNSSKTKEGAGAKLAIISSIKDNLDMYQVLPSERIKFFVQYIEQNSDQLKQHRDPMWLRFFRDCFRIVALAVSGVALYRAINGQPVNFFRPSHGKDFLKETESIIKIRQDTETPLNYEEPSVQLRG